MRTQDFRRRERKSRAAQLRPVQGRFFKSSGKYVRMRLSWDPFELGEADWILYRANRNPYRKPLRKHARYNSGFTSHKLLMPRPPSRPL